MRIGVVGTGHVGLVTCATLAHLGHVVVGRRRGFKQGSLRWSAGESPFFEPGLDNLLTVSTSG
jgi:UDPglucose 6-dehydrogenase